MQGVLVFASAAARNAAITSPQEGQFAYTKDTNGLWYYDGAAWVASGATGDIEGVTAGVGITGGGTSGTVTITNDMATTITASGDIVVGTGSGTYDNLPIGTTGQLLTADTTVSPYKVKWATPASGSALTLITPTSTANSGGTVTTSGAEVSAAGVTSVSLNGVFTSTYKNYLIMIYQATMNTPSDEVRLRLRASGSDTAGSVYYGATAYALFAGSGGYGNVNGGSAFDIVNVTNTVTTAANVTIQSPQLAVKTTYQLTADRNDGCAVGGGYLNNTTQYDGFTFYVGVNTLTCKILVYGFSN
jgi:hypothetical protein